MSSLIACDAPSCTHTTPEYGDWVAYENLAGTRYIRGWIHVRFGDRDQHFHNPTCLLEWVTAFSKDWNTP